MMCCFMLFGFCVAIPAQAAENKMGVNADFTRPEGDFSNEYFSYSYFDENQDSLEIAYYVGEALDVVVPEEIDGLPVVSIGEFAFNRMSNLTSIKLPNTITIINVGAFYGCSGLTSFDIPSSVKFIKMNAFALCDGITDIVIPDGVTQVQSLAFNSSSGLKSIKISASVTDMSGVSKTVQGNICCGCKNLETIVVDPLNPVFDSRNNCNAIIVTATNDLIAGAKNTVIPTGVTTIGVQAFAHIGATNMTIPSTVTYLRMYAFSDMLSLTRLNVPSSVTKIDDNVFAGSNKLTIYCQDNTTILDYAKKNNIKYVVTDENYNPIVEPYFKTSKMNLLLGDKVESGFVNTTKSKVTFSSSNKKVVKVDNKGKLTALKEGKATITAKVDGKSSKLSVQVKKPSISGKASVKKGKTIVLEIKNSRSKITWISSNKKIATVDKNGKVKGKKKGVVVITAIYNKIKLTQKITVK